MLSDSTFKLLELAFFFVSVLGFIGWQIYSVRPNKRRSPDDDEPTN